ncbi:acyl-CoA thioesterase [Oceanicoccus sagamiensis]|uniref:Acyl-CoA thioesterase n=1 Tax=Oceanicoccus sagamiensis TaxID=716816 RepID=A0A1X9NEF8_9GAMM|nr:acyl-CoA thioesterase [Oceanicoccus sagamiensis]ARN73929.1 acyl-CoA thioesterase [Oceanicoccus sagamiensis]
MSTTSVDKQPEPYGELAIQTIAMPAHTNPRGEIFAGWVVSQMDLAAGIAALDVAQGRVATVAINGMQFLIAVHVGAIVSCYTEVTKIGRSSVHINVEVWINEKKTFEPVKVTEGEFVFVAIDDSGRTRPMDK